MNEDENEVVKSSPAFAKFIAKRLAASRPLIAQPKRGPRPWQVSFGPATVPPGETITLPAQPKVLFRGERLLAGCGKGDLTDRTTWSSDEKNGGAEDLWVTAMYVGKQSQLKPHKVQELPFTLLTVDPWTGGQGGFDACDPALTISIMVTNRGTESRIADLVLFGECSL